MKTKHSHKCQESLRSDNSAPIHSVLRAHTTDTSLERSTSQFRFTLCSSSAESPFLSIADSAHRAMCPTLCIAVTRLDCPLPAECCLYATYVYLEYSTVTDILLETSGTLPLSLEVTGIPAALTSESSHVATLLGAVAPCYTAPFSRLLVLSRPQVW